MTSTTTQCIPKGLVFTDEPHHSGTLPANIQVPTSLHTSGRAAPGLQVTSVETVTVLSKAKTIVSGQWVDAFNFLLVSNDRLGHQSVR